MTAAKGTSNIYGVTYAVYDAAGNPVVIANGEPLAVGVVPELMTSTPTAVVMFGGIYFRITQAQAASFESPAADAGLMDADGELVSFIAGPPTLYTAGQYESLNTSGLRMRVKGAFCDLTSANIVDIGVVMAAFAAAGSIS